MSAQEGPVSCYYCGQKQNDMGRCVPCAENNGLMYVLTYRWCRDVYLDFNGKRYCISFSHIGDNAKVQCPPGGKTVLEISPTTSITLQNIKDKLKTYLLFS